MSSKLSAKPTSRARQVVKSFLRFLLRYKWLLKFGQWLLKKQPKISSSLLGLADLTTPYVPPKPIHIHNKKQLNYQSNEPMKGNLHQLLVDVSVVSCGDSKTGIQRVTRNILKQLIKNCPEGCRVEAIYRSNGVYRYAHRFMRNFRQLPDSGSNDATVDVFAGDIFLGLDLTLDMEDADRDWLRRSSQRGLKVYFILHDLLPLVMPDYFRPQVQIITQKWLEGIVSLADGVICVSKSTAQELGNWLTLNPVRRIEPLKIGYFHNGADIESDISNAGLTKTEAAFIFQLANRTSVLMVGTLEPRKGYAQTLSAFEELWKSGENIILIIVGKQGWKTEELAKRLKRHPELGKRLFWFENASDEMLFNLYKNASVLLMASEGEGFGLPLIEAARQGIPLIVRDLPVFHEVVDNHAFYFRGTSSSALYESLKEWFEHFHKGEHPLSNGVQWLTWEQSAGQLVSVLLGNQWIASWDDRNGFILRE